MPTEQISLRQAKAARNHAHKAFQTQLLQVKEDLAARGIGGRIVDRTGEAVADAAEIASAHKGIVAGIVAALAVWLLRGPIIALMLGLWYHEDEDEDKDELERNVDE